MIGIQEAEHEETSPGASILLINRLACSLVGQQEQVEVLPGTQAAALYGRAQAVENFMCNYGLNPAYLPRLSASGMVVSGVDSSGEARIIELPGRFYLATLFLPQMNSSPGAPHPLIAAFVRAANKDTY